MKISVQQAPDGGFSLTFDDTEVVLGKDELKTLLLQLTGVIAGGAAPAPDARQRTLSFLKELCAANDLGIQKYLMACDHDDILVLLKIGEQNSKQLETLYANMGDRSRKIFEEDLAYKFNGGASKAQVTEALKGLLSMAEKLKKEGALIFP